MELFNSIGALPPLQTEQGKCHGKGSAWWRVCRRIGRIDKGTKFLYYGDSLIAETDGSNNIIAWYTPGVSESRLENGVWNTYYYLCAAEGTTRELADSLQRVTDAYSYNAWGEDMGQISHASDNEKHENTQIYVDKKV